MTFRQLPIIPTIIVLGAVATMVALGIWQLGRAQEKEALLAQFAQNQALPLIEDFEPFPKLGKSTQIWPPAYLSQNQFRSVRLKCDNPYGWRAVAGRNAHGQTGFVHQYVCQSMKFGLMDGSKFGARVYGVVGWSRSPEEVDWQGGEIVGVLAPTGDDFKVVATLPIRDLEPLALPNPKDVPNNHLAYAGQWFFFALTALVIYGLAIRKRLKEQA